MSDMPVSSVTTQPVKKTNYVKKGAIIGAAVDAGLSACALDATAAYVGKDQFIPTMKSAIKISGGKGKFAAKCLLGTALAAAIGAGIGKLVQNHKEKQAQKAQ